MTEKVGPGSTNIFIKYIIIPSYSLYIRAMIAQLV
jgi:hypothetical protein